MELTDGSLLVDFRESRLKEHICVLIGRDDFDRLQNDDRLFLNIIVGDHTSTSYLVTYEELYDEVLDELSEDELDQMEELGEEDLENYERELFSDYILKRDIYSYQDLMNYHSGDIEIWEHPTQSGDDLVTICFIPSSSDSDN